MFFFGSSHMICNLVPYMQSYFYDASLKDVQTIFSLYLIMTVVGNFPGTYIVKNQILHPKIIILIGGSLGIGGTIISSYFTSWKPFEIFYPICAGFGNGFTNTTSFYIAWLYWPDHRAYVTGLLNSCVGLGAGISTYTSTLLNNPNNVAPHDTSNGDKPYGMEVAKNFPVSFRYFAMAFAIIMVITVATLPGIPKEEKKKTDDEEQVTELTVTKVSINAEAN